MIRRLFKQKLNQFFNRRGEENLPLAFNWRRLYVLPSKTGWFFFLIWFLMLMAGLNFNNNMSLMMVFMLFGLAQVALYKTFFNVNQLKLEEINAEPVFLGEAIELKIQISAPSERVQITATTGDRGDTRNVSTKSTLLCIPVASHTRGLQAVSRIKFFSRYPLGLFTVWLYCIPKAHTLVYPKPESPVPDFPNHGGSEGEVNTTLKGDELTTIKEYQQGDPVRDIAWKKSAQSHKTWLKEFNQTQGKHLIFDSEQINSNHLEFKLSRMTAWVLAAEKAQANYQIKLPGHTSELSSGHNHMHRCLKSLALYQSGVQS